MSSLLSFVVGVLLTLQKPRKTFVKKKTSKKVGVKAVKADPFTELERLQGQKKKTLSTPKDTRKPRSQFSWGRHRGPKA